MSALGTSHGYGAAPRTARHAPAFGGVLVLLAVAAVWALAHPYRGIISDAGIYIGRALADLDPDGIGRDPMFVLDGQFQFAIFPLLIRPLVAHFGTDATGIMVSIAGDVAWFFALVALAFRLAQGRTVWAIVVFVAVLPMGYGSPFHFTFAETAAVPRPFAEAATLAGLSAYLGGARLRALILLSLAVVLHPISGLAGLGAFFVALCIEDRRWLIAGLAGVALCLALGAAGVPLVSRLFVTVDFDWIETVALRSPLLFPTLWPSTAFGLMAVRTATILIAAALTEGPRRRLLLGALIVGTAGVAATVVFNDLLWVQLFVQAQPWRASWLMGALSGAAFALCTVGLWRRGPPERVVLALLTLGWFFNPAFCFAAPAAATALVAYVKRDRLAAVVGPRFEAAVWGSVVGAILVWRGQAFFGYAEFLAFAPPDMPITIMEVLRNDMHTLPACLLAAAWALDGRPVRPLPAGIVTAVLVVAAALLWDVRTPTQKMIDSGRHPPELERLVENRPGEVLWVDGLAESWYLLGRPQWQSAQQAVSIIFSRPLAMEWRDKTRFLMRIGLAQPKSFSPWRSKGGIAQLQADKAAVGQLCSRPDAPSWIITSLVRGGPRPEGVPYAVWTLPDPFFVMRDDDDGYVWDRVDAYAVIACGAPAGRGAAVQLTAR